MIKKYLPKGYHHIEARLIYVDRYADEYIRIRGVWYTKVEGSTEASLYNSAGIKTHHWLAISNESMINELEFANMGIE